VMYMADSRHQQKWTQGEVNLLTRLFREGNSIGEIASKMKRQEDAIVHKAINTGLVGYVENEVPERYGQTWTSDEESQLRDEFSSGKSITDIAKIYRRDRNSILHKLVSNRLFDITSRNELLKYSDSVVVSASPVGSVGGPMVSSNPAKVMVFKEDVGFWDRILGNTKYPYWKEKIQGELDQRYLAFDSSIDKLREENQTFKKHHMEISEEENNLQAVKEEWEESLKSLGNLLNKNTTHEKQMWDTTQKTNRIKGGIKVKQKFKDSDVDEIRFNNMMEYIKQYPELQSKSTINHLLEQVKEKRNEVLDATKQYQEKIKDSNTYLNTAKLKLQKIEDELDSYEAMKKEADETVNNPQDKGFRKIFNAITFKTAAEKDAARVDFSKYDRKINVSRNQLKQIKEDLEAYEKREFKPIVTQKFEGIE